MDGNKDEAVKCVAIAKEAIASGNKERALKFIAIAQRLNHNLNVDDLISACENLDSSNPSSSNGKTHVATKPINGKHSEATNGDANYTEEHIQLVRKIRRNTDYYEILGVEKTCSVEEVKKAYRKLSLKVHPDKNKAPGSEDAFKKVSKAFKCLSDEGSRRQYDQTGLGEGDEYNNYNVRRRRTRTGQRQHMFEDEFDADEIFRSFFSQGDMFRAAHVYRTRRAAGQPREEPGGGGGGGGGGATSPNLLLLLQLLPFLLIIVLACLPFSEPEYSLQRNYTYQYSKVTGEYGVEFYVKSSEFDGKYPVGSDARGKIENSVVRDYKNMLWRYCNVEMQRRTWSRNLPTPHCDKLKSLGVM